MDEFDIENELNEIKTIHYTIDENNPLLYILFLNKCREKLEQHQIQYVEQVIENLKIRNKYINKKLREQIDKEGFIPFDEKLKLISTQIIRVDN